MGRIRGFPPALLILLVLLVLLPTKAHAFGAGNIASISAIEGKNWRHGDIEDTIKALAFIKGHKWTSAMIKRVYFGNWLRDYSQAMDVGTLKNLPADTIRILVWILSFMSFGYATAEYEVTSERLGVYRPEEHIDNPKDYADNQDARQYDPRLRPPVRQIELEIDPHTGMKNYIANERGDWATSAAYVRYSLSRSIHYGRMYTSGGSRRGKEEDLCEALRCLGQGLHTLEDFAAHTNYCELALREMGFHNVFPHTGSATQMNIRGRHVFPLVTGTFGVVDFLHSVLGEASDHFTQSELNEMDITLGNAQSNSSSSPFNALTGLLGNIPGTKDLVTEAEELKRRSDEQEYANRSRHVRTGYASSRGFDGQSSRRFEHEHSRAPGGYYEQSRVSTQTAPPPPPPATGGGASGPGLPGLPDFDPQQTIQQIYPILQFRDKVVRTVSSIIEKIPGLEDLVEKITEAVTVYVFSLLAPFIRPIINAASQALQTGSAGVIDASGKHQYEPWTDPTCTDPTHSLLSKDHFANVLNEPAGHVAAAIVKYVVPRVLYAWQHIDVPVERVMDDCVQVFHHPALKDMNNEAHRTMFEAIQNWVNSRPDRGANLNDILSAEGVREGRNLKDKDAQHQGGGHSHGGGGFPAISAASSCGYGSSHQQHQQTQNQSSSSSSGVASALDELGKLSIPGISQLSKLSSLIINDDDKPSERTDFNPGYHSEQHYEPPPHPPPGDSYGGYSHHAPPQPQYESGFNIPPPSGYERYHQNRPSEGGWREYQPPEHGSHTYDYYQQPQYGQSHHSRGSSHSHSHHEHSSHEHSHSHSHGHGHGHEHGHGHGHSHEHSHHHHERRHEYDQGYGGYYN
ncbi:HET-C domain protein HetC [Rasamsonia emersonii CBS 393.64]|uniref:HET-C domain protein HetC n=1 Tax=Rasamsonia emersonii (strain ATCC 16479 / CBS 393.64 / IMI 116815) TaxID=1408163 RepID=A0A0F4Z574_RASE3|nr:HET-C domain protein HetC [Rasamsonia emersonii CBS 393.64]KKA25674.1 HET-C domain protein HetC [Rasamsonia emersonii CBS 393.64]